MPRSSQIVFFEFNVRFREILKKPFFCGNQSGGFPNYVRKKFKTAMDSFFPSLGLGTKLSVIALIVFPELTIIQQ